MHILKIKQRLTSCSIYPLSFAKVSMAANSKQCSVADSKRYQEDKNLAL